MSGPYEILAIIAARGDSKGLPRKNVLPFLGKPLIAYTIEEAKKSALVTRSIVSTEDSEIIEIARRFGAEVPFVRPCELAADNTHEVEFLLHAVEWLRDREGYKPDIVLFLSPTSPLKRRETIDRGIQTLIDAKSTLDSVRSITESPLPPYKMWEINGSVIEPLMRNDLRGLFEPWNMSRQKLPTVYWQTGAMSIFWLKTLTDQHSTSGSRIGYCLMDPEESIDIDTYIDFKLAEILMAERNRR